MLSEAQRTLVKSPPELWAELSEPDSLARHLSEFGEVRLTNSVPETKIEWEGEDSLSGTVKLAASGWGTKVTLTALREQLPQHETPGPVEVEPLVAAEPEPLAKLEPEPLAEVEPDTVVEEHESMGRRGFFARLFRRRSRTIELPANVGPEPEPEAEPRPDIAAELAEAEAQAAAEDIAAAEERAQEQATAVLTAVLDRLGAAHHRPFSRT
jgi:hypothetical protein